MSILTKVTTDIDEQDGVMRVYAFTKFNIADRSSLNRVAGRVAIETNVGQRTLVSAAYDELGIDLVWSEGFLGSIAPEDKYEDAKKINFMTEEVENMDNGSDIYDAFTARLQEEFDYGELIFNRNYVVNIWEIPLDL